MVLLFIYLSFFSLNCKVIEVVALYNSFLWEKALTNLLVIQETVSILYKVGGFITSQQCIHLLSQYLLRSK